MGDDILSMSMRKSFGEQIAVTRKASATAPVQKRRLCNIVFSFQIYEGNGLINRVAGKG